MPERSAVANDKYYYNNTEDHTPLRQFCSVPAPEHNVTVRVRRVISGRSHRFENPLDNLDSLGHRLGGINSIAQDSDGFIWLAGESGLGRFDGHHLTLYQFDANDPHSLPTDFVWQLLVDDDDVMWVATERGLSRYRDDSDDFETLQSIHDTPITQSSTTALAVDETNVLYVGSNVGFYRINSDRNDAALYLPNPPMERDTNAEQIRDLAVATDGTVWIATAGMGVAHFDPLTEGFEYFLHNPENSDSVAANSTKAIHVDWHGRVWMGTYGSGISVYDPATAKFRHYTYDPESPRGLKSGVVADIFQDKQGTIWVSLDQGGLARYDEATDSFQHFLNHPSNPNSVASNQLRAIFEDHNGDLWIGAFPSGVSYFNRSRQHFRTFTAQPTGEGLRNSAITNIFEDSLGTLWIGTEGGLHAMNRKTGAFRHYNANPANPHALAADPILAIEEDSWGNLWVGTWAGGLHRFDRATEKFLRYSPNPDDPTSASSAFVWDIMEDSDKNLWIATENAGLDLYDRANDSFINFRHDPTNTNTISGNFVCNLIEDSRNNLWLGTYAGLDMFDPSTRTATRFTARAEDQRSPSSVRIRSFLEDSRGLIWIGTRDTGVDIYDPASGTFRYLDTSDGLPASTVSSILEDNNGDVWLATTSGLARVNPATMKITVFNREHGLAGNNFNRHAALKDKQGNLYFGSTEGMTVFNPNHLVSEIVSFPVRLTGFRVLNEKIAIDPQGPLKQSIARTKEINLSHDDIMFSFTFAALNFRNVSSNRYAYRLEGFDRVWNNVGPQNTATYTNLDPGTYVFRVRASNGGDGWNEAPPVRVIVQPPPWKTWWAYFGYVSIVGFGFYYRSEYRRLRHNAETYRAQSITDPLTTLYNRAGIWQVVQGLFSNPEICRDATVILMDIDHFKGINDRCGHDAGDKVLQEVSKVISDNVRSGDYFGRWGGEEFILICPSTPLAAAESIGEKLRAALEASVFDVQGAQEKVTVSVGVATADPFESFEDVLKRADVALYKAKTLGRNGVCASRRNRVGL